MKNGLLKILLVVLILASAMTMMFSCSESEYKVTLNSDNESAGVLIGAGSYKAGTDVIITATANTGYSFSGWYEGDDLISANASHTFKMPEKDVTYTAKWTRLDTDFGDPDDDPKPAKMTEGLQFTLDSETDKYIVSGYAGTSKEVVITGEYNGKTVYAIAEGAFKDCSDITKVTVADSIVTIGKGAFSGCSGLLEMVLPFVGESREAKDEKALFGYIFGEEKYVGGEFSEQYYVPSCYEDPINVLSDELEVESVINCIPSKLKKVTVNGGKIGSGAFSFLYSLSQVVLSEGVTEIGSIAFINSTKLREVSISSGVANIAEGAFFMSTYIEKLTVSPENEHYKTIDNVLFSKDGKILIHYTPFKLESGYTVPDGVETICDFAFYGVVLSGIVLPESVTQLGYISTVGDVTLVMKSTIPLEDVNGINEVGFIIVPDSAYNSYIEAEGWESYEDIIYSYADVIDDKFLVTESDGEQILIAYFGNDYHIEIPDTVTVIDPYVFYSSYFGSLKVPESVTKIGYHAFDGYMGVVIFEGNTPPEQDMSFGNDEVRAIVVPDSALSDYLTAFADYQDYGTIFPSSLLVENKCIIDQDTLIVWYGDDVSVTVPNGIKKIAAKAFSSSLKLKEVILPEGLKSIGGDAFAHCYFLGSVSIPSSVEFIGHDAFYGCDGVETYNSIEYMDNWALNVTYEYQELELRFKDTTVGFAEDLLYYSDWDAIKKLVVPSSVKYMNGRSFEGDYFELVVIMEGTDIPETEDGLFIQGAVIIVPDSALGKYRTAWSGYNDFIYPISDVVDDKYLIDNGTLFIYFGTDAEIVLPEEVTVIEDYAFAYCESLRKITIHEGVTHLGEDVFYGCYNAVLFFEGTIPPEDDTSSSYSYIVIIVPDSAKEDYMSEFNYGEIYTYSEVVDGGFLIDETGALQYYIGSDSKVTIPDSVKIIRNSAFRNNNTITEVLLHNNVIEIEYNAFSHCTSLVKINIPDSVESIGMDAFLGCTNIEYDIYENVYYINNWAISVIDKNATTLVLKSSTKGIAERAFESMRELTSLTLPDGLLYLSDWTFGGCASLESVIIPDSVLYIGFGAFNGCSSLESLTIPFIGYEQDELNQVPFGYIFGATIYYANSYYVPSSLQSVTITGKAWISDYAFYQCDMLTEINFSGGVGRIGRNAFQYCNASLFQEYENVRYLGDWAVSVINITVNTVVLKNGTVGIADFIFGDCYNLESITVPASVEKLSDYFFGFNYSVTKMKLVFISEVPPALNTGAFNTTIYDFKIYVPEGFVTTYKTADGWSDYEEYIFSIADLGL